MNTYNFSANGIDFGNFDGNTINEAKEAFATDAGYSSWAYMLSEAEANGGNNVEIREVLENGQLSRVE